ncbi:MAG: hypothetical protein Q9216_000244 [Gyalolechia sp. 2 TL-2023]
MDRKADPQTQLMIDEAILDYLFYTAIKALLSVPEAEAHIEESVQRPLDMVDGKNISGNHLAFISIFHALHPEYHAPAEVQFRLRLLQFSCLFKTRQRLLSETPSLSRVNGRQDSHRKRGKDPVIQPDQVHLRDTLPLFLALSAAQNLLQESTITELWMRLAAGYMAHTYAEQVLSLHDTRSGLLEEIFQWSFDPARTIAEGSDEWIINEMFEADANSTRLWEDIKSEHMCALRPPPGTSLTAHLEAMVSGGLSIASFKEKISEFLSGLLSAHSAPLLTQLESGEIDGLTPGSTMALKRRAGFV